MDQENQIAELYELISNYHESWKHGNCDWKRGLAEAIYEANYRKQSGWIVTKTDSGSLGKYAPFIEFKCSQCGAEYRIESGDFDWEYGDPIRWESCLHCGAKMNGGE